MRNSEESLKIPSAKMKPEEVLKLKNKSIACPKCNSEKLKRDGQRKTLHRGLIQRYRCKSCKHRFVVDDGFFRMRNDSEKVTLCMDLYFKGVSLRKIQDHLQAFYPQNSSHMSIYRWLMKYCMMISKLTDKLEINSGYELMGDEMEYHRRKSHKQRLGIAEDWFIDVIDTKTRFVVSSEYVDSRNHENLKRVFRRARKATGDTVKVVTTDGLLAYPKVLEWTFGLKTHWNHKSRIIHNVVCASQGEGFNHKVERLHNSIRERTKIMRGFHGSIASAYAIMKGIEINYNFIRKHMALGKTPAEEASIDLELGLNKWLSLILISIKNQ